MASRSITVKVATPKVIAALEAKLAQIQNDFVNQYQLEEKFQQDLRAWNKDLTEYALANMTRQKTSEPATALGQTLLTLTLMLIQRARTSLLNLSGNLSKSIATHITKWYRKLPTPCLSCV